MHTRAVGAPGSTNPETSRQPPANTPQQIAPGARNSSWRLAPAADATLRCHYRTAPWDTRGVSVSRCQTVAVVTPVMVTLILILHRAESHSTASYQRAAP